MSQGSHIVTRFPFCHKVPISSQDFHIITRFPNCNKVQVLSQGSRIPFRKCSEKAD